MAMRENNINKTKKGKGRLNQKWNTDIDEKVDSGLTLTAQRCHHFLLTSRSAWAKQRLGCDKNYLQITTTVSCRSDIDSLLFVASDDEIAEWSTSHQTVQSTWPPALWIYLLQLWFEDCLTWLLSWAQIDFPALNSTGYLMLAFDLICKVCQCAGSIYS